MARHKETMFLGAEALHEGIDYKAFLEKLKLEELRLTIEKSPETAGKIIGAATAGALIIYVATSIVAASFGNEWGLEADSPLSQFLSFPTEILFLLLN